MDKLQILNQYSFYAKAVPSMKKEFEAVAKFASLPEGAFYFHEGDPCIHVALIGKGRVRIFKVGESGREITLYHVNPKETCILTTLCLMAKQHYSASAQIEMDAEVVLFPAAKVRKWITSNESLREWIFETMAMRTSHMMALIEEISFRKIDQRLAEFLVKQFTNPECPLTELHLTHDQIAKELNSAREVMSRLLKEFERQGAIELYRGRIRLLNEPALQSLLH